MKPASRLLEVYRQLVNAALLHIGWALDSEDRGPVLRRVRARWRDAPAQLQAIDTALDDLGREIFRASTDSGLSAEGQARSIDGALSRARATIDPASANVRERAAGILRELRAASYPPRPAGDVATQEAVLAGIKSDLRMTCDPLTEYEQLHDKLAHLLRRAIADGDELRTWLLASTPWPSDYLEARDRTRASKAEWDAEVAEILDSTSTGELVDVRRVYRRLADGKAGVPRLELMLSITLPNVLDDLAAWRPVAEADAIQPRQPLWS